MIERHSASPCPSRWRLPVLSCLGCLALGANQASALPPVQVNPPGFVLVQAVQSDEQAGTEQQDQQAPFAELNQLLEATRAKLEELFRATASVAEQREEIEALKQAAERSTAELQQANTRRAELERANRQAEARVAELNQAVDVAVREAVRIDEELAGVRQQNADLEESLARAEAAREAAAAETEEVRAEVQARFETATEAAEQSKAELAELRDELERTRRDLASAENAREQVAARADDMEEAVERSGAEAERLKTELAQAKEQLGQATSAAVEAERARQVAGSELDQLRSEAERVRGELAAAKSEAERFGSANAELREQVASLHAASRSAMETARQNLVVMEAKIEELHAALTGAGVLEAPAADERSAASAAPTASQAAAVPGPDDKISVEQGDDRTAAPAAAATSAEPTQGENAGLARFDANVRYLNSRALEAAGADLFSGIEPAGDGVVHVSTTPAWDSIPPSGQRSYLNSLFDLWTVAQDRSGPAVVRIVDASGRVLLEKSGPASDDARE